MVELYSRELGSGDKVVVIVHGLYGSSGNWLSVASKLYEKFRVILPDMRNHGQSPHTEIHSYKAMADDLAMHIREKSNSKVILAGHSMGGKVAMRLALDYPGLIEQLVVIDVAPKAYQSIEKQDSYIGYHERLLQALQEVNIETARDREQVDMALSTQIPSKSLRQFLLKNLSRDGNGNFYWQINITALMKNMPEIMDGFSFTHQVNPIEVPTLFIRGENSSYLVDEDFSLISRYFVDNQMVTIPGAGHWVHAEQPALFLKAFLSFIDN